MITLPPNLSADLRDAFEERAAFMEFDAGMTRDDAERKALLDVSPAMRPRVAQQTLFDLPPQGLR